MLASATMSWQLTWKRCAGVGLPPQKSQLQSGQSNVCGAQDCSIVLVQPNAGAVTTSRGKCIFHSVPWPDLFLPTLHRVPHLPGIPALTQPWPLPFALPWQVRGGMAAFLERRSALDRACHDVLSAQVCGLPVCVGGLEGCVGGGGGGPCSAPDSLMPALLGALPRMCRRASTSGQPGAARRLAAQTEHCRCKLFRPLA